MKIDPTLIGASCAALEQAINHSLSLDSCTQEKLANYAGRVIQLSFAQPELTLYFRIDSSISVLQYFEGDADAGIQGSRSDWLALLTAEDLASAFINGIFSLKENQQHEIRTTINHLVENTKSYQLIKSVLGKNSKSAYQGRIFVNSKAQKTDGYQLSKAILLDETSEFNAKPELEIYADDVKCSHGSASGSLNENSIFYLMSRGLNYQQSKELLINGFLLDVVEKITDSEIKNLIKNIIGLKE